MAGLDRVDRIVPQVPRRRAELAETGLAALRCEPIPERAGDFYAAVKFARQQRGLALGARTRCDTGEPR